MKIYGDWKNTFRYELYTMCHTKMSLLCSYHKLRRTLTRIIAYTFMRNESVTAKITQHLVGKKQIWQEILFLKTHFVNISLIFKR